MLNEWKDRTDRNCERPIASRVSVAVDGLAPLFQDSIADSIMDAKSSRSESLKSCMEAVGIPSFRSLAQHSGVSRRQVDWLRQGEVQKLSVQSALQLAETLDLSFSELLHLFGTNAPVSLERGSAANPTVAPDLPEMALPTDRHQSQLELENMRSHLLETFQAEVLGILESLILQWPTAAYTARQNPTISAAKLIPLAKPIEQLLQAWEIEAIAAVGQIVNYDPTVHQWIGDATPPALGQPVQVSHIGYRQRERLLYRAKVRAPKPEVVPST
ncbi:helix-turn-helix domain-containing protein [Altericista sp. CCNU0014]|uniref:helix-turn-helix domain-containing protein n=1 Tax=Altericista sp. CCNU0014 TaxID=3082949 RepID=UPI00384CCA96